MFSWHLITGEYPPQPGGVSDYTHLVARALAQAGDQVDVWAPETKGHPPADAGVRVRRLRGHYGPRALFELERALPHSGILLVQYVPHAFGWKGMNLAFCAWLRLQRRRPVWVMFHEVAFTLTPGHRPRHRILAAVQRSMARMVCGSAQRNWASIPAWAKLLRQLSPAAPPAQWLPIPSTIPLTAGPAPAANKRVTLGHFGTYGPDMKDLVRPQLAALLAAFPQMDVLMMGRGSEAFAREFPPDRVQATGPVSPAEVSRHLWTCDVMFQPDRHGVNTRRTSVMCALEHGRPVVTNAGPFTEALWAESGAVALAAHLEDTIRHVRHLVADPDLRERMGHLATKLYADRFDLRHTVNALRAAAAA